MLPANFRSKQIFIGVLACSFAIATPTFPTLNLEIGQRVDAQMSKILAAIKLPNLGKMLSRIIPRWKLPKPIPRVPPKDIGQPIKRIPNGRTSTSFPENPTPTSTGRSRKPPRPRRRSDNNAQSSTSNTDTQYVGTVCRGNDKVYIFTTSSEWLYFKNSEFVKIDNPSFNLLCDIDVIQSSSNKFDFSCSSTSYVYYRKEKLFYPTPILVPGVGCTNG